MDGVGISGQWINKNTGKVVNVRSSIIDGDNMIVITDSGQIDMNDFSMNYVQASDEIYDESGHVTSVQKVNPNEIVTSFKEPPRIREHRSSKQVIDNSIEMIERKPQKKLPKQEDEDTEGIKLVKKLLEKRETNIEIKIICDDFPLKELEMLQTIYDVTPEDISKCIVKYFMTDETFNDAVKKFISEQ